MCWLHKACAFLVLFSLTGLSSVQANTGKMPAKVTKLLDKNNIAVGSISVLVAEMANGAPILSVNPDVYRNPASVQKLVTTLASLDLLGPTFGWPTKYYADGRISNQKLEGDLIMLGTGDPFLTADRLWNHVLTLRERGIRDIDGNLVIDNSQFNIPPHDRNAFDGKPQRLYNVGPDAALTNFSATRFVLEPRTSAGIRSGVNVFADPPLANLQVVNQLKAASGKCVNKNKGWSLRLNRKDGKLRAIFEGSYRARCGLHSIGRSIVSNQEYTYQLFRYLWESSGGTLSGSYRIGSLPETAQQLVTLPSRTLAENIVSINKYSNNVMARQLLLTLGSEWTSDATKDTRLAGIQAIRQWMEQVGIPTAGFVIENGSGLSRIGRISANQLHQLLRYAWQSTWRPEFMASLSLTALDGTMRKRLRKTSLRGRVRIKTGLINGVRSMAGYVHADSGKHYAVIMMIDSERVKYWNGNQIQDALLQWVFKR